MCMELWSGIACKEVPEVPRRRGNITSKLKLREVHIEVGSGRKHFRIFPKIRN